MNGMWEKPFGIQFIAFGDVVFSAGIEPLIPISSFSKFEFLLINYVAFTFIYQSGGKM